MSLRVFSIDRLVWLAGLLALLAYAPFLDLPPLPDDYLQVHLGQRYGSPSGWLDLMFDPLYRSRATSLLVTWATLGASGFSPWILNASSLLIHGVNTVLVYSLGASPWIGRRVAALAAIVFAVRERHHEAVIWYAALPELLVVMFALVCLACWVRWLKSPDRTLWLAGSLVAFALALISKESAIAIVPLAAILAWPYRHRGVGSRLPWVLALFLSLALADLVLIFTGARQNHHFSDGTFQFTSQFAITLLNSAARGFWIWASAGTVLILAWRSRGALRVLAVSLLWIAFSLLPYSFVTYMPRIPSRHHYLASVGFALIIGAAMVTLRQRTRSRWPVLAVMTLLVVHNLGYLWVVKRSQFEARSEPIEAILRVARKDQRRPLLIRCLPISLDEAKRAMELRLGEGPDSLVLASEGELSLCDDDAGADAHSGLPHR